MRQGVALAALRLAAVPFVSSPCVKQASGWPAAPLPALGPARWRIPRAANAPRRAPPPPAMGLGGLEPPRPACHLRTSTGATTAHRNPSAMHGPTDWRRNPGRRMNATPTAHRTATTPMHAPPVPVHSPARIVALATAGGHAVRLEVSDSANRASTHRRPTVPPPGAVEAAPPAALPSKNLPRSVPRSIPAPRSCLAGRELSSPPGSGLTDPPHGVDRGWHLPATPVNRPRPHQGVVAASYGRCPEDGSVRPRPSPAGATAEPRPTDGVAPE